ncbi:MAG: chorismate mutase [Gemmatimonadetes bacterium]|nr:chorismate mutase [Gemmatimonadota bacterium]
MNDSTAGAPSSAELVAARNEVERVDRTIVRLIAERLNAAAVIAAAKRSAGLPVLDPPQEARVVRRAGEWAREAALPEEDVRDLFWRIITITRRSQGSEP